MRYAVGSVEELRDERCRVVEIDGRRVGVISVDDTFFAVRDRCPHRPADICQGTAGGTFVASAPHEPVYG